MNLRERIQSQAEKNLRIYSAKWAQDIDPTWNFKLNSIRAVNYFLTGEARLGTGADWTCTYGFIKGTYYRNQDCITLRVPKSELVLIVNNEDFNYYESLDI